VVVRIDDGYRTECARPGIGYSRVRGADPYTGPEFARTTHVVTRSCRECLFTSESAKDAYPGKTADQICESVLAEDPYNPVGRLTGHSLDGSGSPQPPPMLAASTPTL
jgi:hypothetical protein